jgi:hypothetical protein
MKPKGLILIALCIVTFLVLLLGGCTRKPTQVIVESDVCMNCHYDGTYMTAIMAQWQTSVHATGAGFERNGTTCAPCHTSEGFVETLETGADSTTAPVANPSVIGCRTCHHPHTTYDFTLRTNEPVRIMLTGEIFDRGNGNLCANCHQPRILSPLPIVGGDSVNITSTRWSPHHGTQSAMLIGTGGYELPGSAAYENSEHTTAVTNGCPTCHMATPYGIQAGGHTMNLIYVNHGADVDLTTGCNRTGCHNKITSFDVDGVQTQVEGLLEELGTLLVTEGILNDSTGEAIVGKWSSIQAGALLNYLLVKEDRSMGVHNADYIRALLQNSIDALSP